MIGHLPQVLVFNRLFETLVVPSPTGYLLVLFNNLKQRSVRSSRTISDLPQVLVFNRLFETPVVPSPTRLFVGFL